jgi:hypothetical protein
MKLPFSQLGGAVIGTTSNWGSRVSSPFTRITVLDGCIQLDVSFLFFSRRYTFPFTHVSRLSSRSFLFCHRLCIEHTIEDYPALVYFFTLRLMDLSAALEQCGLHIEDSQ